MTADGTRSVGLRLGYSEIEEFPRLFTSLDLDLECAFRAEAEHSSTDAGTLFGLPRKIDTIGCPTQERTLAWTKEIPRMFAPAFSCAMRAERDRQIH